jgi:hypothetical protein
VPQHHTDDNQWIMHGREERAGDYFSEMLNEGMGIEQAYVYTVKAFPDCRSYLKWLTR